LCSSAGYAAVRTAMAAHVTQQPVHPMALPVRARSSTHPAAPTAYRQAVHPQVARIAGTAPLNAKRVVATKIGRSGIDGSTVRRRR
jgi:hypothetical protein